MDNNNQKMLKITLFCFFIGILGIGIYNNQDGPVKSTLISQNMSKKPTLDYSINTGKEISKENNNKLDSEKIENIVPKNESVEIEEGYTEEIEKIIDNSVSVNSIKIAKEIDVDKDSPDYRQPIVSYHTITTLDDSIIKNVNYYPSLFVWTSINTDNEEHEKNGNQFSEQKFTTIVKHENMDVPIEHQYKVTANTPEWREWIEIDLTEFETESYLGNWTVEVIHEDTGNLIESRTFNLIKNNPSSLAIETELERN